VYADHEILNKPIKVKHEKGRVEVLKKAAEEQEEMGEALTLDAIINSIDAELIAKGPSDKGPNRGSIVSHGSYVLWAFEGPVSNMTEEGRKLFINTVIYTARQKDRMVLEIKKNQTRDGLFNYLDLAKNKNPGFLSTMKQYLPKSMKNKNIEETEAWLIENRPFLRNEGRRFMVDSLARQYGIPNYKRGFLEKCISNLESDRDFKTSLQTLIRYTGLSDLGSSYNSWHQWFLDNETYLYFSDCEGSVFKIDEEAKESNIPTEKLRRWSSENIDYSTNINNH